MGVWVGGCLNTQGLKTLRNHLFFFNMPYGFTPNLWNFRGFAAAASRGSEPIFPRSLRRQNPEKFKI